jgi:predicted permease
MEILALIQKTLSNPAIIGAIFSTISIIGLGYYFRKTGIFNNQVGKILSSVVLTAALPALAFTSFMQDNDPQKMADGMTLLIFGFVIYIALIFVSKIFYFKYVGDEQTALRNLSIFGSTTFFSTPIISSVFGPVGVMLSSIFNISYRVFLYSYGYIQMSGMKMSSKNIKEMFLNPIILATFAGLIIWAFQAYLPQVDVANAKGEISQYAFLRIDKTAPWLQQALKYLAGLASPLAWLSIGATLGQIKLKEAAENKTTWYYAFIKVVLIPAVILAVLLVLHGSGIMNLSYDVIAVVVLMMMAPAATVITTYAISFDRQALLASNGSLISTILAVIFIPIWIIVLEIIQQAFF